MSSTVGRPCGYHGDPTRACSCPPSAISRYQKRTSGPLLDRIDTRVNADMGLAKVRRSCEVDAAPPSRCYAPPLRGCNSPPAPSTGCSSSPARSPTSRERR